MGEGDDLADHLGGAWLDRAAEHLGLLLGRVRARVQELRHLVGYRLVRLLDVGALRLAADRAGQAENARVLGVHVRRAQRVAEGGLRGLDLEVHVVLEHEPVVSQRHLGQPRRAVRPLLEHRPPLVAAVKVHRLELGVCLALDAQAVVPDGLVQLGGLALAADERGVARLVVRCNGNVTVM